MKKFQIISDTHLEFLSQQKQLDFFQTHIQHDDIDALIVAGDFICNLLDGCDLLLQHVKVPVIYVPGNHEYYQTNYTKTNQLAKQIVKKTHIHLLNPGMVVLHGIRFIGATLWTDYQLYAQPDLCKILCLRSLNDHAVIRLNPSKKRNSPVSRLWLPDDAQAVHYNERLFITEQLNAPFAGKTVVVTHHAPAMESVDRGFKTDLVTAGFASDLTSLMERYEPDLWIHGHVHNDSDYKIYQTRIVCHPKGYPNEKHSVYEPLIINL